MTAEKALTTYLKAYNIDATYMSNGEKIEKIHNMGFKNGISIATNMMLQIIDWRLSLLGNTVADGLIKQELDIIKTTIIKELNEE